MYCKGLRSLWLKGNGLTKIENLNGQIILRTLYLQENSIEIIENLKPCSKLDALNLSKNIISKIDNLSCIKELKAQLLSFNNLTSVESIKNISTLPMLNRLDIQSNNIDGNSNDVEILLKLLESCRELRVLYLKGNKIVKAIPHYRQTLISRCKSLKYVDDWPVFDKECKQCNAWGEILEVDGTSKEANEAERKEVDKIRQEKYDREETSFLHFQRITTGTGDNEYSKAVSLKLKF